MHVLILKCVQVHHTIYWILFQVLFRESAEKSRVFALFSALQNGVLRKNYRELKMTYHQQAHIRICFYNLIYEVTYISCVHKIQVIQWLVNNN